MNRNRCAWAALFTLALSTTGFAGGASLQSLLRDGEAHQIMQVAKAKLVKMQQDGGNRALAAGALQQVVQKPFVRFFVDVAADVRRRNENDLRSQVIERVQASGATEGMGCYLRRGFENYCEKQWDVRVFEDPYRGKTVTYLEQYDGDGQLTDAPPRRVVYESSAGRLAPQ